MMRSDQDLPLDGSSKSGSDRLSGAAAVGVALAAALAVIDLALIITDGIGAALQVDPLETRPLILTTSWLLCVSGSAGVCGLLAARSGRPGGYVWVGLAAVLILFGVLVFDGALAHTALY